jgi:hypothetical protein
MSASLMASGTGAGTGPLPSTTMVHPLDDDATAFDMDRGGNAQTCSVIFFGERASVAPP